MVREPDATMQLAPQNIQLMSKHRVLSFKPCLRLEWRGQDRHNETEEPNHSASLGDSITSSTRIRFSVHTGRDSNPRPQDYDSWARAIKPPFPNQPRRSEQNLAISAIGRDGWRSVTARPKPCANRTSLRWRETGIWAGKVVPLGSTDIDATRFGGIVAFGETLMAARANTQSCASPLTLTRAPCLATVVS
jgi:hypothetical protein